MACGYDLVDEVRPVVGPFLLENRDEDQIEFIQKSALGLKVVFGA